MSWDIVLFSSKEKIKSIETLEEKSLLPIDFNRILNNSFKEIRKNENHREIIGGDFTIEFFIQDSEESNIMISIYGEKGLFEIIEVSKKHNLQVFDTSLNDFINLNNPLKNGFSNFQNYLKQIRNDKTR